MSMFSQAEAERIAEAVREVEQRTTGELVVAEVARSDDYADVRSITVILVALCAASGAHLAWPALPVGAVLAIQFAAGVFAWLISASPPLLRRLVPAARSERAVARAAELAFFEHAVFRTRDRTGVLIFLSALERRVVILGDEGIHARVQQPGWSELVTGLVRAIKEGRAGEGVCEVVARLGETLGRDLPIREGDTDELANYVRSPK